MKKQQSNSNIGRKDDAITVLEFVFSNLGQSRINKFWKIMAQNFFLQKFISLRHYKYLLANSLKRTSKLKKWIL